jgi:hypothetical protein
MLTTNERRILLYMTDDERHTVPEIALVLQIALDVMATLRVLERFDIVSSRMRLMGGAEWEFWHISRRWAERRKYFRKSS